MLTSTDAAPHDIPVVLHISADSLTYDAPTTVLLMRHRSAPSASADDEKPPPTTVSGVPPSDAPSSGYTDDTDAHAVYVKNTELLNDHC